MRWNSASLLLVVCLSTTIPLAPFVAAQDPPKADADRPVQAGEVLATLDANATSLANLSVALLDVNDSLVADNGLGIDVAPPEAALRAQLGLEESAGLVVTAAPEESPGAKAGLKVHDVIVQLDDEKTADAAKLKGLLDAANGKAVKLRIRRAGKPIELEATPRKPGVVARLQTKRLWTTLMHQPAQERYRIGVSLSEADDTLRAHLRLVAGEGLVVTEVVEGGAAARADVKPHDVLIVLDGKRLTTVEAINAQIQEIKEKTVELRFLRGGNELTVQIAPRKTQEAAFLDHPLVYWDTKNCQSCHSGVSNTDYAHLMLGTKLHAAHSAWTDGLHGKLYFYKQALARAQDAPQQAAEPKQQVETLKNQLAEMQKTLTALEAALTTGEPKPEDKK